MLLLSALPMGSILPLAADTFGGFGSKAEGAMHEMAKQERLLRGSCATPLLHVRQRLQCAVMRGVYRQLLCRLTHHELEDE